jgi:urocanate hydratase
MMANPIFIQEIQETLRVIRPLSINTQGPISLIMEMLSIRSFRAGADIMAENHIDFKYPSYVQDGTHVF